MSDFSLERVQETSGGRTWSDVLKGVFGEKTLELGATALKGIGVAAASVGVLATGISAAMLTYWHLGAYEAAIHGESLPSAENLQLNEASGWAQNPLDFLLTSTTPTEALLKFAGALAVTCTAGIAIGIGAENFVESL